MSAVTTAFALFTLGWLSWNGLDHGYRGRTLPGNLQQGYSPAQPQVQTREYEHSTNVKVNNQPEPDESYDHDPEPQQNAWNKVQSSHWRARVRLLNKDGKMGLPDDQSLVT